MKKTLLLVLMLAIVSVGMRAQTAEFAKQRPQNAKMFSPGLPLTISLGTGTAKAAPVKFEFRKLIDLYDKNNGYRFGPSYANLTAEEMKAIKEYAKFWYFESTESKGIYYVYAGWDKDQIMGRCGTDYNAKVPGFDMDYCEFDSFLSRTLGSIKSAFDAQLREAGLMTVGLIQNATGLYGQYAFSIIPISSGAKKQRLTFSIPKTKQTLYSIEFTHDGKKYHSFVDITTKEGETNYWFPVEEEIRKQHNLPTGEIYVDELIIETPAPTATDPWASKKEVLKTSEIEALMKAN
ncbi:MAG: hypothetical protein LBN93_04025 [Candidatus Symbiothrix sp.]|jgi:hypothetical protein|nr:hypothetical protein [Candidatus Symbiothrix sp.]